MMSLVSLLLPLLFLLTLTVYGRDTLPPHRGDHTTLTTLTTASTLTTITTTAPPHRHQDPDSSCIYTWCISGTIKCLYWAGVTSYNPTIGAFPGEQVRDEGTCRNTDIRIVGGYPETTALSTLSVTHFKATRPVAHQELRRRGFDVPGKNMLKRRPQMPVADPATTHDDSWHPATDVQPVPAPETTHDGSWHPEVQPVPVPQPEPEPTHDDTWHPAPDVQPQPESQPDPQGNPATHVIVTVTTTIHATTFVSAGEITPSAPAPDVTAQGGSLKCDLKYCEAGTQFCMYFAGITGFDPTKGPVPGETRTPLGPCTDVP